MYCILVYLTTFIYINAIIMIALKKLQHVKTEEIRDDGIPRFYITGDKHRDFRSVKKFCIEKHTRKYDVLIILGDAGLNYYGDGRDDKLKAEISALNITILSLQGNKEKRPQNIETYGIRNFYGGNVYYEPQYPNLYFAKDSEVYTFAGKKYMAVGGASSVDKFYCMEIGLPYFEDEMPDDAVKEQVKKRLRSEKNEIYGMLTHTCPMRYLPREMFLSVRRPSGAGRQKKKQNEGTAFVPHIDRGTEEFLEEIENMTDYSVWYCGHYHVDKSIDKIHMMYRKIRQLDAFSAEERYE